MWRPFFHISYIAHSALLWLCPPDPYNLSTVHSAVCWLIYFLRSSGEHHHLTGSNFLIRNVREFPPQSKDQGVTGVNVRRGAWQETGQRHSPPQITTAINKVYDLMPHLFYFNWFQRPWHDHLQSKTDCPVLPLWWILFYNWILIAGTRCAVLILTIHAVCL